MTEEDRCRYARSVMIIKTLYGKIMRELAARHIPAQTLYQMIHNNTFGIKAHLNPQELKLYPTLQSYGYDMIDESFMYRLISTFNIVQPPTHSWSNFPTSPYQTTLGDDIERIRKRRNDIMHVASPHMSEDKFREFFDEVVEIAKRMDVHMHKGYGEKYEEEARNLRDKWLDENMQLKYIHALEKILDLTSQFKEVEDHWILEVFYGNDIEKVFSDTKNATAEELEDTVFIQAFIRGVKNPAKTKAILEKALKALEENGKADGMVVTGVEESSILLHIIAKKSCFKRKADFQKKISQCLRRLLTDAKEYLEEFLRVFLSIDTSKESLAEDARKWRQIRTETLPRLQMVEDKLNEAGMNVRQFRQVRNATAGLGVFGLFLAPFTLGTSIAFSVGAMAVGAGGITLGTVVIENYLTGDVLNEAQGRINIDKQETQFLRQRVNYYMERGGSPAELRFASELREHFPDAIINVFEQSISDYIKSFISTEVGSVFRAKDEVRKLRRELEAELRKVEELERVNIFF